VGHDYARGNLTDEQKAAQGKKDYEKNGVMLTAELTQSIWVASTRPSSVFC
jgi:maltoporin